MDMSFAEVWEKIQKELSVGKEIDNWGKARGYSGNQFTIIEISEDEIVCDPPKASYLQHVPKLDFEAVWEIWPKYLNGSFPRYIIRDEITRFSSYIISIFKYLGLDE